MPKPELVRVAELLKARNSIDAVIASEIGRPMTSGHLGEWLASAIFGVELESSATSKAVDGRFTVGGLAGRTVNVKWYLKREGLLDVSTSDALDYYLVMTGPISAAASSRGATRPWCIDAVYLFDAHVLLADLRARGVKIGVASSVRNAAWAAAEIYPRMSAHPLALTDEQRHVLELFSSPMGPAGRH